MMNISEMATYLLTTGRITLDEESMDRVKQAWREQATSHAAAEQHRLDEEDRAGYLAEREAYTRRLRADISPEEAAEELMGDPDEWDGQ